MIFANLLPKEHQKENARREKRRVSMLARSAKYKSRPEIRERERLRALASRHRRLEEVRAADRAFHASLPKRWVSSNHLRRKYGITLREVEEMAQAQGGVCLTCFRPPPSGSRLVVDHCHSTGKIRGLLCSNCNRALGYAKDSPENLERMAAYLRRARNENGE